MPELRTAKVVPGSQASCLYARNVAFGLAAGMALMVAACTTGAAPTQSELAEAPGTIELNQSSNGGAAMGGGGTGTVYFHGELHNFAIGGEGVDGSAVAIVQTSGEVFHLQQIARFPGTYRRAPAASAVPGQPSGGLWLQNAQGTVMHLRVPAGGRMPDIGTDAVDVVLVQ